MADESPKYYRRVFQISAEDSPNVQYGLLQEEAGITPTNDILVPGVITYQEYKYRRATWDKIRQWIGLDGKFWEGKEMLMFPPSWLTRAERLAIYLQGKTRIARGIGVDPAEGGDSTAISVVDELGLIELISEKTPNTNVIVEMVLDSLHKHNVPPDRVLFDRGGGGKQHADRLRAMGYPVRTVGFGESPAIEPKRGRVQFTEKVDVREQRYTYANRRVQMYDALRILLDPMTDERDYDSESAWKEVAESRQRVVGDIRGFAIPHIYSKIREQLSPIPLKFNHEQTMVMPPKSKRNTLTASKELTLTDLIGYSPDEADSLVLAIHAMQMTSHLSKAGVL